MIRSLTIHLFKNSLMILFLFGFTHANAADPNQSPPILEVMSNVPKNLVCQIQITKTSAWAAYDVQVIMYDFNDQQPIATYDLASATASANSVNIATQQFDCAKYQNLIFRAKFSPPIWQNDKDKLYISKRIWNIQTQMLNRMQGQNTLTIEINFPDDFVNVPQLL